MARRPVLAASIGAILVVTGTLIGLLAARQAPSPAAVQEADPVPRLPPIPISRAATVIQETTGRAAPGGPVILDDFGDGPVSLWLGSAVVIVEGPVPVGVSMWVRVYVLQDESRGPSDYLAWIPLREGGRDVLAVHGEVPCPADFGLAELARVDRFTLLRCLGGQRLTLEGASWHPRLPVGYRVTPSWLGGQSEPEQASISLSEADAVRFPDPRLPRRSMDLHVPPGVVPPPLEFGLRVEAHLADPASAGCTRRHERLPGVPAGAGIPDELPADATRWCASELVLERWTVVTGPERRPVRPGEIQLHRHDPSDACAGVGLPMLTFRVDPTDADPIWLEAPDLPAHLIPSWSAGFTVRLTPTIAVVDAAGQVVAEDGTRLDPDRPLAGHDVCPTDRVVTID